MYDYLEEQTQTSVVGSFAQDKNTDFKNGVKSLIENFRGSYSVDPIDDLLKVIKFDSLKEQYKESLFGDVIHESYEDPYMSLFPQKMEQLFENTALQILKESSIAQLSPIVGLSLPILKKNFIEGHANNIVMTEVPTKPFVKTAFERKFLKDKAGNKYYIPEIFYNDEYKNIVSKTKGKPISTAWYPAEGALPMQDLSILTLSGGTMEARDTLSYDFAIEAVKITVPDEAGTGSTSIDVTGLNISPDMGAHSSFTYRIKTQGLNGAPVEDILIGQVDFYSGKVSVACTAGKITKVRFTGHLSNENNTETVELDREREVMEWKIPDGQKINTGLTVEKIKDYKALFDLDITAEIISDMSTVLTQFEDSSVLSFLDDSLARWKGKTNLPFGYSEGFVESSQFSCTPTGNSLVTTSQWVGSELKFYLNRLIDKLKVKLKNTDLMFVVYGNPNRISLIQDDVKWVIDEDTKTGGIQLDYRFGVMTSNKNRIHVISSLKVDASKGIRVVAYPLTKELITFKQYKYSLNIENVYRNPNTPLTPNIMGTSRYLTTEVLPVQGEFLLTNDSFGIQ